MAQILYSLSGDGRGHATRAHAILEALQAQGHDITVFTFGQAFDYLAPLYRDTSVRVCRMGGLTFSYGRTGRLCYWRTVTEALKYLRRLPGLVSMLGHVIRRERPSLVVSDFEPALPRAARAAGLAYVSVDHQRFLVSYDLSCLPRWLRVHARYMAWVVRTYYSPPPSLAVVSSFYFPEMQAEACEVKQVGVLLRPEVERAVPRTGHHVIAYFRRPLPPAALRAMAALDCEIRIYGMGERPTQGKMRYLPVQPNVFVEDLASSRALVCTAGNQLVGEALYLSKPVFAIPELGNYEQYINAHFLAQTGCGTWAPVSGITTERLQSFLDRASDCAGRSDVRRLNGLPTVLKLLEARLAESTADTRHGTGSVHEVVAQM